MKNIKKKFKINITTYCFFLLAFLCGYFKNVIYIFLIVFLHELGHVLAIKFFKYKVIQVELFPFGGITKIDKPINSSINKEFIIAISGVTIQFILAIILIYFKPNDYILINTYNNIILLFNLLPIIPLDGSIIMHTFLEKFFSYQKAFFFYQLISFSFFILFLIYNIFYPIDNYFICIVLLIQFLIVLKNKKYLLNRFYLERMLYSFPYKKIENNFDNNISSLKKETRHFFYQNNHYLSEKEMLSKSIFSSLKY